MQSERIRALHEFPYFGAVLSKLSFFECDDVPTMAIDKHGRVYVNVPYWDSITLKQRVGVMVHELQHVLRKHFVRGEFLSLSPEELNIIGDIEINDSDKMRGFLDGLDAIYPETYGFPQHRTFEEYAELWKKKKKDDGENSSQSGKPSVANGQCGSAADGQKKDYELPAPSDGGPGMDETDLTIVAKQVAEAIKEAARTRGDIPGNLIEWSAGVLSPPKVNWQSKLRNYSRNAAAWVRGNGDYSYSKLSRFPVGGSVIVPGSVCPVPEISLMVDTSGSMSSTDLENILPEAQACLRMSAGSSGKVCVVDTAVHSLKPVTDVRKIPFAGRGGTDLRVGFEAISKLSPRPDILVVFTDGYTPWPDFSPRGVKTIVALMGRHCSPDRVPGWAKTLVIPSK
ncbi:MAG: hypothetical protein Unbinned80contig1000_36 [Prokaryotic dsDNA virus sp.]|nr:MAG: hypothetical protein Unbinned80contig1000_36 [Prokaryotic dsDNA virus sp.]